MAIQTIERNDLFGRIGKGLGQGLSEQLPKEIERSRLSQGLQQLAQQKDMTPFERFAAFSSIPGITPQMIQSGTDLLRDQSRREDFRRLTESGSLPVSPQKVAGQPSFKDVNFANLAQQRNQERGSPENVLPTERGQPQIVGKNPTRQEVQPALPWTPERRIDEIARLGEQFPNLSYPEIKEMASENEQRYLAAPEAVRKQDEQARETQKRLHGNFKNVLERKLQKEGSEVFADISGPMQNNLLRGMEKDLIENPSSSEDDVVNSWTEKALDLAKTKKLLEKKAATSNWAIPILLNKENYRRELEDFSDIYRKAGNSEEFVNDLQTLFGFSPSGASSLAYKPNEKIQSYINKNKKAYSYNSVANEKFARKAALDIAKDITPNDSILSINRKLLEKNAGFDSYSFLDELSKNKDEIGLNQRQRRELTEGGLMIPSWADILVLPIFREFKND